AEIMRAQVAGLLQLAKGDKAGGLAALAAAAKLEAAMPKPIARPYPIKPAGETYAEALLASGDAAGAVREFQAALKRTPRRAASLIGAARAAAATGQAATAAGFARDFASMWKTADTGRAELADAMRLSHSIR